MSSLRDKLLKDYLEASEQSVATDFYVPKKKKKAKLSQSQQVQQGLLINDQNLIQSNFEDYGTETKEKIVRVSEGENRKNWIVLNATKTSENQLSPPRRLKHDDNDLSPPRRPRHDDNDLSPPRRPRHDDNDLSPPRRPRHDDLSPPRRPRHDDNSDLSPPRRPRHDDDNDLSPPRRPRHDDDNDLSPPRRPRSNYNSSDKNINYQLDKTKSSKSSITKTTIHNSNSKGVEKSSQPSGTRGEDLKKTHIIEPKSNNTYQVYTKIDNKTLLEDPLLKMQEMEENETGGGIKKLKSKIPSSQRTYQGWIPPNRFNILASYKWDGVDRSNGYENKYFQKQSEKKYEQIRNYQHAIYE